MSLTRAVRSAVGIRADEASRVGWLVAHSLFVGLFSAFFLTSANALFLARFEVGFLPVAYIAAALVGYVALMLFSRLQKALPLPRALVLNLAFLLAMAAALWLAALASANRWIAFLMFVWVGPAFSLLALGYWALAGRLFDLRQGKRLFALVGAGEEVVTVIGLFSVPVLVRALGGPVHLLPIALAGLVGCLAVVVAISMRFAGPLAAGSEENAAAGAERRAGLLDLVRTRYFLLLAALVVFLNVGNYVVDFGFLSQVRGRFQGPTAIAQFIAVFFGVTKTLELLAKVFLSGRLLTQFGLKFGLLAMPVLLAGCAGFAIAIGTLGLPAAHFFVLVALAKLVWIVSRTTTFEPAFRVFYQPVPAAERLGFQTHVEGTTRQLAIGVVGLGLLAFSRSPSFDALTLFYALVPILAGWMIAAVLAHRDYRDKLLESLTGRAGTALEARPVDRLRERLVSADPLERAQAFDLLEKTERAAFAPGLAQMLADPSAALRAAALEHVGRARIVELEEWVRGCRDDPDAAAREAARAALERLRASEAAAGARERVLGLAASGDPAERVLAAEVIGRTGEQPDRLWVLLFDAEWTVRRAALAAAGRLGRPEFWPQILAELESPVLSDAAAAAAVSLGESVLAEAERTFAKASDRPRIRQRILEVYDAIGGGRAEALLAARLAFPHESVRSQAVAALSRARYQADAVTAPAVTRAIEALVGRTAWNMSAVLDLGDDSRLAPVARALEEEIDGARARLLQLLSLLHDTTAIGLVRENLERGTSETTVYALEILELFLSDELKPLVFPLVEGLAYPQVLRRLENAFPRHRLPPAERLSLIVNRDYDKVGSWTRASALAAEGELAGAAAPDLVASLYHPDPLMSELAAFTMRGLDPAAYAARFARLDCDARARLSYALGPDGTALHWESRSVYGRTGLLRGLPGLGALPSAALVRLARSSEELVLNASRRVPSTRAPGESFYVNVDGVQALVGARGRRIVPPRTLLAFGPGAQSVEVLEKTRFVRIDPDAVLDLAAEHASLVDVLLEAREQRRAGSGAPLDPAPAASGPRVAVAEA